MTTPADDMAHALAAKNRRDILTLLETAAGRVLQAGTLQLQLKQVKFTPLSTAQLLGHLTYLRDLGLVMLLADGNAVRLTAAGSECAQGLADYPGVARESA